MTDIATDSHRQWVGSAGGKAQSENVTSSGNDELFWPWLSTVCNFFLQLRWFHSLPDLQTSWHSHSTRGWLVLASTEITRWKLSLLGDRVDEETSCLSFTGGPVFWVTAIPENASLKQLSGLWLHAVKLPPTVRPAALVLGSVNTLIV